MNDPWNTIRLTGRITSAPVYDHTVLGEAFYRMEVSAARLSGTEDVLPVTISERLLGDPELCPAEEGSRIDIIGQIRSYNLREGGRTRLAITVFAREAVPAEEGEGLPDRNDAELEGHICKRVVYRTTPFSREIADIMLAVNRRYGKSDYLPVIAWGRNARFAGGLEPGDLVVIRGRLQSRGYQKTLPDGGSEQRTAYEISCSSIEKKEF